MFFRIPFAFLLLFPLLSLSQPVDVDGILAPLLENLDPGGELDWEQLNEGIFQLIRDPIRINQADPDELSAIPLISVFQAHAIYQYRRRSGKILDHLELIDLNGFDLAMVNYLRLVTTLETSRSDQSFSHSLAVGFGLELEKRKGFEKDFTGPPGRTFTRYRGGNGQWRIGLALERDAGEKWWSNGPDHWSGSIHYAKGSLSVNLGDYHLNFGQGATLWTGFGMSSPFLEDPFSRSGRTLSPYSGNSEGMFLRGLAVQWKRKGSKFFLFGSRRSHDASLKEEENSVYFTSINQSGKHRTPSELAKKGLVNLSIIGVAMKQNIGAVNLGAVLVRDHLDMEMRPTAYPSNTPGEPYNGDLHASLFGDLKYSRTAAYWELAFRRMEPVHFIAGWKIRPEDGIQFSLHTRRVWKQRRSSLANPLLRGSGVPEIAAGACAGIDLVPRTHFRSVTEIFHVLSSRYQHTLPGLGKRQSIQVTYQVDRNEKWDLRYSGRWYEESSKMGSILQTASHQWRVGVRKGIAPNWTLDGRIHASNTLFSLKDAGWLFLLETKYDKGPWKVVTRFSFFRTNGYENRIYSYESNVPFQFSTPALFGSGQRFYVLIGRKAGPVDLWLRLAQTRYFDKTIQGSGVEENSGPLRSEIQVVTTLDL